MTSSRVRIRAWRLAPDVAVECVKAFLEVEAEDPEESANIDLIRDL